MRTRGLGNEQQLEEGEEWGRRGEGPFKDRASMSDTIKTRQGVSWSKAHRERRQAGARHEGPGGYTPGLHEERGLSYPRQEPGTKAPAV